MKVLILANNDVGLYKFRKELLERLLEEGHEVVICLPYGSFVENMKCMGCKFIKCEIERRGTNPFTDLRLIWKYISILNSEQPDIVFTYTIKPNVYGGLACGLKKVPYVVNITGLGTAVENSGLLQKITLTLYKWGLRKAQKVFFQNTANKDFMVNKGIVSGEYDLLPGSGVNLDQYKVLPYPEGNVTRFAFIARVMKEKGIEQYLDAAKYIKNKYPDTTEFHVCGFCEEGYEQILKELHAKGIINYHGLVKNVAEIHAISSCTVHPTYYPEGISNVLLESAACGRPIITTDRPGCREVIDEGVNGYFVESKDSETLINAIERFLGLEWREKKLMGIAGRKKVELEFDRKIVEKMYMNELL